MRFGSMLMLGVCLGTVPAAFGQKWEFGGGVGWGFYTSQTIKGSLSEADASFKNGVAWSGYLTQNVTNRWAGEFRYTFQRGDARLQQGSTEATFGANSHAVHYEFQFHTAPMEAKVRPFFAGGGGVKFYRGTGRELPTQPLSNLGLLTRTNDTRALVTAAAGVKVRISERWNVRVEVRDYITPFPANVLAPALGATVGGWMHDIVPMFTFAYTF